MRLIAAYPENSIPYQGAKELALGANRVCMANDVPRSDDDGKPVIYELRIRFTVPAQTVLDLTSVRLYAEPEAEPPEGQLFVEPAGFDA